MKINDPERFARELQGDFSEIDAYMRGQRIKMLLVGGGLALCLLMMWLLPW